MSWRRSLLALALVACNGRTVEGPPCGDPEVWLNDDGFPQTVDHCGTCGVACAQVLPQGAAWQCARGSNGLPQCVVTLCPAGTHQLDDFTCVLDHRVVCLPCDDDDDCTIADPGSRCVTLPSGDMRCGSSCDPSCPLGFDCVDLEVGSQCVPTTGFCGCTPNLAGQELGCRIESPLGGPLCTGVQTCEGDHLSACVVVTPEICDDRDDDCDGEVDEGFKVDGQYVSDEHCGACNHPCLPHVESMVATCVLVDGAPSCELACREGFVDIDGVVLNGCECERHAEVWPPPAHGVDGDCDGSVDPISDNVYVAKSGDDANPGTLAQPVASITRGVAVAGLVGKTVFVAQGIYDEQVEVAAGVSIYGGYRSDFHARDLILFPVLITHSVSPGRPVLVAEGVAQATVLDGLTIVGTDAILAGAGATAVVLRDVTAALELNLITVVAGRGADGRDGASSAAILAALGVPSLSLLDGTAGGRGSAGFGAGTIDCIGQEAAGGSGGGKVCPVSGTVVSGGGGGDASCPATGCAIGSVCGNGGCTDFTVAGVCDFDGVLAAAVPNPAAEIGTGAAGGAPGAITYDAPTTRVGSNFCDDNPTLRREGGSGGDGGVGSDGSGGVGFAAAGTFDLVTGLWRSGNGSDGGDGSDGSGGGGGTQGNGYDVLAGGATGAADQLGGAGGGGGGGGCGAPGAAGGQGGGSSIGVAVLLTTAGEGPSLASVRVVPAAAGDGGDGGVGASGGSPGAGGRGGDGSHWCARRGGAGGDGGRGGVGGGGGGGGGGSVSGFHVVPPSAVIGQAYIDGLRTANEVDPLPAPGRAGRGGYSPGASGSEGAAGDAETYRLYF